MGIALTIVALVWVSLGTVAYVGQFISAANFELAQRLGLQEKPENVDPMHSALEKKTAQWDVFILWTAPIAGVLGLLNHPWWPALFLIAGTVYLDAGGREWFKILGLREHGTPIGSAWEMVKIYGTYGYLALTGSAGLLVGLLSLT